MMEAMLMCSNVEENKSPKKWSGLVEKLRINIRDTKSRNPETRREMPYLETPWTRAR